MAEAICKIRYKCVCCGWLGNSINDTETNDTSYTACPLCGSECKKTKDELKEPICKMSVFIEEYDQEANYCALATLVKCEGLRDDSNNCPYWKRASE